MQTEDEDLIASGTCGSSLNWKLDTNGTLTVYGYGVMKEYYYDSCREFP